MGDLLCFPTELIQLIAKQEDILDTVDLGNLRLTCRALEQMLFAPWAKEYFSIRQINLHPFSIQSLVDISNHPTLRVVVKKVIICDESPMKTCSDKVLRVNVPSVAQVFTAFEQSKQGSGWDQIGAALSRLPNCHRIEDRDFIGNKKRPREPDRHWRSYGIKTLEDTAAHEAVQSAARLIAQKLAYEGQMRTLTETSGPFQRLLRLDGHSVDNGLGTAGFTNFELPTARPLTITSSITWSSVSKTNFLAAIARAAMVPKAVTNDTSQEMALDQDAEQNLERDTEQGLRLDTLECNNRFAFWTWSSLNVTDQQVRLGLQSAFTNLRSLMLAMYMGAQELTPALGLASFLDLCPQLLSIRLNCEGSGIGSVRSIPASVLNVIAAKKSLRKIEFGKFWISRAVMTEFINRIMNHEVEHLMFYRVAMAEKNLQSWNEVFRQFKHKTKPLKTLILLNLQVQRFSALRKSVYIFTNGSTRGVKNVRLEENHIQQVLTNEQFKLAASPNDSNLYEEDDPDEEDNQDDDDDEDDDDDDEDDEDNQYDMDGDAEDDEEEH